MFLTPCDIHEIFREFFDVLLRDMVLDIFDVEVFLFSGQQAQNPLLLLEQYSDDEVDEEVDEDSNKNSDHDGQDVLLPDCNDEVSFFLLFSELLIRIRT